MMRNTTPDCGTYRAMAFTKLGRYREALQSYDQALIDRPKAY